ncbi:Non-catalytic module family EXPN protein [Lyophyllum atratum]|nr:Non-catalytic module family EXPN protein [Lyophyllum atratum]
MVNVYFYSAAFLAIFFLGPIPALSAANTASTARAISQSKYSRAHSLGDDYKFDARDGWETINATDLQYKYRRDEQSLNDNSTDNQQLERRVPGGDLGLGKTIGGVISNVWKGMKAIGNPETVTITWYTGHDLKNPSCWAQGHWAPTDRSFACATTLRGWHDRPQCFKFLELCNTPKKCVFVRVVDSCAGCKEGSRHIDLTRAAFGQLAAFDDGVLNVQLRGATEPEQWYEDLWGPKHKH